MNAQGGESRPILPATQKKETPMEFTTEFKSGFPPQEGYYLVMLQPGLTTDKRYDVDWFRINAGKGEWVAYYAHNIQAWAELPNRELLR